MSANTSRPRGIKYATRLPANSILQARIAYLLTRPVNARENGRISPLDCRSGCRRDRIRSHRASLLQEGRKSETIRASSEFIWAIPVQSIQGGLENILSDLANERLLRVRVTVEFSLPFSESGHNKELMMARNAALEFIKELARPLAMFLAPGAVYRRRLSLWDIEREMDLLPAIVPRRREAIDVGANMGVYSFALSSLASHVHVFEPIPDVASYISGVLPDNVTVLNLAVSDTLGVLDLVVPIKDGKEDTGLAQVAEPNTRSGEARYRVHATTLNAYADRDIGFCED